MKKSPCFTRSLQSRRKCHTQMLSVCESNVYFFWTIARTWNLRRLIKSRSHWGKIVCCPFNIWTVNTNKPSESAINRTLRESITRLRRIQIRNRYYELLKAGYKADESLSVFKHSWGRRRRTNTDFRKGGRRGQKLEGRVKGCRYSRLKVESWGMYRRKLGERTQVLSVRAECE